MLEPRELITEDGYRISRNPDGSYGTPGGDWHWPAWKQLQQELVDGGTGYEAELAYSPDSMTSLFYIVRDNEEELSEHFEVRTAHFGWFDFTFYTDAIAAFNSYK